MVNKIILSFLYPFNNYHINLLFDVSIPDVGSSNIITLDLPANAIATDNRLFWPPDKFLEYYYLFYDKFTSHISLSTSVYKSFS